MYKLCDYNLPLTRLAMAVALCRTPGAAASPANENNMGQ